MLVSRPDGVGKRNNSCRDDGGFFFVSAGNRRYRRLIVGLILIKAGARIAPRRMLSMGIIRRWMYRLARPFAIAIAVLRNISRMSLLGIRNFKCRWDID